jgi:hypothetical protein
MGVKAELDPMFELKAINRWIFDIHISPPPLIPGRGP